MWMLECGCRNVDVEMWVLKCGYRNVDIGMWMLGEFCILFKLLAFDNHHQVCVSHVSMLLRHVYDT